MFDYSFNSFDIVRDPHVGAGGECDYPDHSSVPLIPHRLKELCEWHCILKHVIEIELANGKCIFEFS